MNREPRIEPILESQLAEAPTLRAPDRLRADIASATSRQRQRPPWLASLKEPPMRYRSQLIVGSPTLRLAAIVAATAALTLAIAGAVIAGASPQPSPNPIPPVAPTWVTGHVAPAPSCSKPPPVVDGGVLRNRDVECSPQTWTSSDPRLTGEVSRRWNDDGYQTDSGLITVDTAAAYLQNEGGGWACLSHSLATASGDVADQLTFTCAGDGGYDGLSAILVLTDAGGNSEDIVGLIFSGDFPPLPEPPAAE
jgi:hypothetical protein